MATSKIIDPPRETILQQAAESFARQGYPATTMRELAAGLGVTPAALYYHFRNKDELLLEVIRHGVRAVHRRVEQAMAGEATVAGRIWAGLRAHVLACLEYQSFVAVILRDSRYLSPEATREAVAEVDAYEDLWDRTLEEGAREGLFLPGIDLRLLRLFGFGAMNWITIWYRPGGRWTPEEIADYFLLYIAKGVLRPEIADSVVGQVIREAGLHCGSRRAGQLGSERGEDGGTDEGSQRPPAR